MIISIIIPCFNEKNTILDILDRINNQSTFKKEIILVDDFSTDGSREIIQNLKGDIIKIYNNKNYGKGYSIRKGIERSTGDVVMIQDADLEYDPKDYHRLLSPIIKGNADVVYGTRFTGSEEKRVLFFWHKVGNNFLTLLSNILTNLNLTDMEVCYKAFKSEIIKSINLKENRFGFEPEITAKISKIKNIKIYEVSVTYLGRDYSDGKKIGWKDGVSALYCILRYNLFK